MKRRIAFLLITTYRLFNIFMNVIQRLFSKGLLLFQ